MYLTNVTKKKYCNKCLYFDLGILERQSTTRGGTEEVQGKENGHISVAEEEDQKGSAQPESADGAAASENPGSAKITNMPATYCRLYSLIYVLCRERQKQSNIYFYITVCDASESADGAAICTFMNWLMQLSKNVEVYDS